MKRTTIAAVHSLHRAASLEVSADVYPSTGAVVSITMDAGSLHLQHDITPTQARAMAQSLITAAQLAEIGAQAVANENAAGAAA